MPTFVLNSLPQPPLGEAEVQVWRFSLADGTLPQAGWLADEERTRAGRMRPGAAQEEFLLMRGALRRLLGTLLRCDPAKVELTTEQHGKPALTGSHEIHFNVAHSHGLGLIALSRPGRVGIDVEFRNPAVEMEDIAASSFHPAEAEEIRAATTDEQRMLAFYRCWTRKEAVLKADGRGLIDTLNTFSVAPCAVRNLDPAAEVGVRLPLGSPFWVRDLEPGVGFAGALACDRPGLRVDFLEGHKLMR